MAPRRLGPYDISGPLGRGGMGAVYEAVDRTTGRCVAVKTLAAHLDDDPGLRRRFLGEIETLKSLRHPCIVGLIAFGEEDGQPYFAMELVRGSSLEQLLRGGRRFSWREAIDVSLAITRALKSAHDHGVIHRDLKPANLLFPAEPTADAAVKLADFGIARLFGSDGGTLAGTVVGTAEYMAPEQAVGGVVDHRADLYALGLVMFAMLTGRPPFHGGHPTEVIRRQRTEPPPRVSSLAPDVPRELDELIDRLLAKEPADRPASALAVGRRLAGIAAAGHAAGPEGRPAAGPVAADGRGAPAAPARASPVDLSAPTREFVAGSRSDATAAGDLGGRGTRMPSPASMPAGDPGLAPAATATRFVTVEDLHREGRAREANARRRETAVRAGAAIALLGVVAAAAVALLRPPSADDLLARIEAIATAADADLRDARPLIDRFLADHPGDPRAARVRALEHRLDLDALERRARRRRDDGTMTVLEREYRAAMAREAESPLACAAALEAILVLHGGDAGQGPAGAPPQDRPALWMELVRRQLDRLKPLTDREREQDVARAAATLAEAASLAAEAAEPREGSARDSLLERRRGLLAGLVEIYASRPHVAAAVSEARRLLASPPP